MADAVGQFVRSLLRVTDMAVFVEESVVERSQGDVGQGVERATRFDAVDGQGRRRASFGMLGRFPGQGDVVGLELLDADGIAAVTVVVDDVGAATMSFSTAGNEVLVIGVSPADGGHGPFATACRPDGSTAATVRLGPHGDIELHEGDERSGSL